MLSINDVLSCTYLCDYFIAVRGRVPGLGTQEIFAEGGIGRSCLRGEALEPIFEGRQS